MIRRITLRCDQRRSAGFLDTIFVAVLRKRNDVGHAHPLWDRDLLSVPPYHDDRERGCAPMKTTAAHESNEAPESHDRELFTSMTVAPAQRLSGAPSIPGDKSISHRDAHVRARSRTARRTLPTCSTRPTCARRAACSKRSAFRSPTSTTRCVVHGRGPEALHGAGGGARLRQLRNDDAADGRLARGAALHQSARRRRLRCARVRCAGSPSRCARWAPRSSWAPGDRAPIVVAAATCARARYDLPLPSAQVKSALLLAALGAEGETVVGGELGGRDHTERLLLAFRRRPRSQRQRCACAAGKSCGRPTCASRAIRRRRRFGSPRRRSCPAARSSCTTSAQSDPNGIRARAPAHGRQDRRVPLARRLRTGRHAGRRIRRLARDDDRRRRSSRAHRRAAAHRRPWRRTPPA